MTGLIFKEIKATTYQRADIDRGYAGQTLAVDLGTPEIQTVPVTDEMKTRFIGGKGFDLWLLWQAVTGSTRWDDPENAICIACGPMGGTPAYPGSGKSIVTTISPLTKTVIDSNVGGYFGPYLKFSGFDALKITGKAQKDTIVFIDGLEKKIELLTVDGLSDNAYEIAGALTDHFGRGKPGHISVVCTGPGARHTFFGCLNFTWYDAKRKRARYKQAGRGGIGTVFADKGLAAVVVRWDRVPLDVNHPADPEAARAVGKQYSKEIVALDPKQNEMARVGTTHLVPIMNDYDCLPVNNFRYGQHPRADLIGRDVYQHLFDPGFDGCWKGCTVACSHGVKDFVPLTGPFKGQAVFVDGPEYETIAGCGSNLGIFDPFTILEINFYCDNYGLDTISVGTSIAFVMECFEMGLIDQRQSGGLSLSFGQRDSALELVHQMGRGEGFGKIVGQGVRRMKKIFADEFGADPGILEDIGMESKGLEFSEYMTKESLAQQGGYGLALKGPQHDEAWLIFLDMVHNLMPTFEQKADNLHWFPMWRTWFSLCGLCKLPWNDIVPEDNKDTTEPARVMKHIQWYAEYFSAVTGRKSTPDDLVVMSEAVYNFQRIFNLRMGFGRREHDTLPYRAMGPVTVEEYESRRKRYDTQLEEIHGVDITGREAAEKVALLRKFREAQYEKLKGVVYQRRGWTKDGIPTVATVKKLGIDFPEVLEVLKENGVTA
ncbi:MAG: aldehyde:ferredoxin oxidoreductase [Deltaproteobacteria bacterium]|nr:MAG: aldehyde:ferredoxin oxidoreductase [Deltaproteobacteria bacterium]